MSVGKLSSTYAQWCIHTHMPLLKLCVYVEEERIHDMGGQRYWNSPGAGVPGGCEPPGMCAGNRTQILRESKGHLCSWLMGHLSSLKYMFVFKYIFLTFTKYHYYHLLLIN